MLLMRSFLDFVRLLEECEPLSVKGQGLNRAAGRGQLRSSGRRNFDRQWSRGVATEESSANRVNVT